MKKGIFIISLLVFIFGKNVIFASTQTGYLIDSETMAKVIENLSLSYSEEEISGLVYKYNEWARNYKETVEFTLKNVAFFKLSNNLYFTVSNATFNDELPYMYIFSYGNNTNYSTTINEFVSWKYDTNNKINGANTNKLKYWQLTTSNYTEYKNTISLAKNKTDTIKSESIYIPDIVVFVPTYAVYGCTGTYGYKTYFLENYIEIDTGIIIPTPTPTTTPTPGGGSTGGTDLTPIIGKLDETNKNLEEIKTNIPTSGDIEKATTEGTIKGNETYWGNSGDVNDYDSEKEVKDIIDNTISGVSGEMSKIEAIKILEDAENQFWNRFKVSGNPRNGGIWLKTKLGWYKIPRSSFNRKTAK